MTSKSQAIKNKRTMLKLKLISKAINEALINLPCLAYIFLDYQIHNGDKRQMIFSISFAPDNRGK